MSASSKHKKQERETQMDSSASLPAAPPSLLLIRLGLNPNLSGFAYLAYAITLILENRSFEGSSLLEKAASFFHVSKSRIVDSASRAVSLAWGNPKNKQLRMLFPTYSAHSPTPRHVISGLAADLNGN